MESISVKVTSESLVGFSYSVSPTKGLRPALPVGNPTLMGTPEATAAAFLLVQQANAGAWWTWRWFVWQEDGWVEIVLLDKEIGQLSKGLGNKSMKACVW